MLANIYTDGSDMIFDANGNMAFQSGDQVLNLNDVPDYFNKDFVRIYIQTFCGPLNTVIYFLRVKGRVIPASFFNF